MPFIQRIIEPKYLSHKSLFDDNGKNLVNDFELDAVTNNTLSNVLRQLASLVLVANDIFEDLAKQLQDVHQRSCKLQTTIHLVEEKLSKCDPKTVTVPESDICTFSLRTIHFKSSHPITTGLFTSSSRPDALQKIYESAAPTPVHTIRQLDRFRRDGNRSSKFFVCTPVLGGRKKKYKKIDLEIETRKPMAVEDLRRWTSAEAMGDITVMPDNSSKIPLVNGIEEAGKDEIDHLLPSPEEQMMAVALRFPPSIVAVDTSGKVFDRMSGMRRSMINMEITSDGAGGRRRGRSRRHREKRRNTIAGTSQKEIQQAIAGETATETDGYEFEPLSPLRSKSTDLFKVPKALSPTDNIKNHFNTLKNWSKTKLKLMNKSNSSDSCRPSFQGCDIVDDVSIYETIPKKRREKERKPSTSSSAISIPVSTSSIATSIAVKLRENSLQRRHRRKGTNKTPEEPVHSSSGNWSASSESGRTSIASETTAPPKSSTTTSNNSLNHHNHHHHLPPSVQSRRRYLNVSTSSSVSEGTLTPDINDMQPYHDLDGETSSVYSCDTEGYYTSFHVDSGLKTLKEEEIALSFSTLQLQETVSHSTTTFNNSSGSNASTVKTSQQLTAENEYELFGKGSTSTTTSSAGTVCTTLLANNYGSNRSLSQFAPAVPERKSSLDRKTDKNKKSNKNSDSEELELISDGRKFDLINTSTVVALIHDSPSPDSGHNTSSSPAGSTSQNSHSPNEHLEFSESDLEACDRIERIRSKTAMTSCRIPSMCAITPPQSDDEVSLRNYNNVPYGVKYVPLNQYETIIHNGIVSKNSPILNGKLFAQSNGSKPLHIQIPTVPNFKKEITDIYALPDKSKKTNNKITNIKTISTNGVLETNLDSLTDDAKSSLHIIVNRESGYATIKKEVRNTPTAYRSPSPSGGSMIVKKEETTSPPKPIQPVFKSSLLPSNFIEKFKGVVGKQKKLEKKPDDGDYVTIVNYEKSPKTEMKHSKVEEKKSEYVSLNELPISKNTNENLLTPTSNDSSLERKKRQGARVTLDSEGKVVYSSDSLKRKKQHSTFIPGKFVRESPTPSPLPDHRVPKTIRPVNCSGLIRTNSDERKGDNRTTMSPQLGKIVIKAGSRNADSPTTDFIRMPPNRVVSPVHTPNSKRNDRGVRVVFENGVVKNRSASPASSEASTLERRKRSGRCVSPSSSSSSSNETKKSEIDINPEEGHYSNPRWVSQHPAVTQTQQHYSSGGFPRNHPMYWTLPARRTTNGNDSSHNTNYYKEDVIRNDLRTTANGSKPIYGRVIPQPPRDLKLNLIQNPMSDNYYSNFYKSKLNSLQNDNNKTISSQQNGAIETSSSLTSAKLVREIQMKNKFLSSTPTKEPVERPATMNITNAAVSPILKENFLSPKTTMTSEEIFAAIHKSKKKLNLKEAEVRSDSPSLSSSNSLSPGSSESSLKLDKPRERLSWSPNSCDLDQPNRNEPGARRSWAGAGTSINAFKKLLLQQGTKNSDGKISAVERLKLSKQDNNNKIRKNEHRAPRGILNSRSKNHWRFSSPRTDILSSTIPEDCSEVEKPEDALKYRKEFERSSPLFAKNRLNLDRNNLSRKIDCDESKKVKTPPEEKPKETSSIVSSLESTRKYLQQARLNFFSQNNTSNSNGIQSSAFKKQLQFSPPSKSALSPEKIKNVYSNHSVQKSPQGKSPQNGSISQVDRNEKKRYPIISLETAL